MKASQYEYTYLDVGNVLEPSGTIMSIKWDLSASVLVSERFNSQSLLGESFLLFQIITRLCQ